MKAGARVGHPLLRRSCEDGESPRRSFVRPPDVREGGRPAGAISWSYMPLPTVESFEERHLWANSPQVATATPTHCILQGIRGPRPQNQQANHTWGRPSPALTVPPFPSSGSGRDKSWGQVAGTPVISFRLSSPQCSDNATFFPLRLRCLQSIKPLGVRALHAEKDLLKPSRG